MCYKKETQDKNEANLIKRFDGDGTPQFIRNTLLKVKSSNSMAYAVNKWIYLKDMFEWFIENGIIKKDSIADIEPSDFKHIVGRNISAYLQWKEDSGMSPSTLEVRKNAFRGFWRDLQEDYPDDVNNINWKKLDYKGYINTNTVYDKLPTDDEVKELFIRINKKKDPFVKERNNVLLRVLLGTGMRECEVAGLDETDVVLDDDEPYMMIMGKGIYREIEARKIFLTGDAVSAIKRWLEIKKDYPSDSKALFINKYGHRLNEDNIKKTFKTYGKAMGGNKNRNITPHMIRHYYATVMPSKTNFVFVQQQLGHKSGGVTARNYTNGSYGLQEQLAAL